MRLWPLAAVTAVQLFLALTHGFIYWTWISFWNPLPELALLLLRVGLTVLAFSFAATTLASFRSTSRIVAWFYTVAATWLGFLNFLFWAACASWIVWLVMRLAAPSAAVQLRADLCCIFTAAAVLAGLWGLVNARWIRVRRVMVRLEHLPAQWRGRKALLISDLHLGAVNGRSFAERIVRMARALEPDIVFIPGDLFDGGKVRTEDVLAPFSALRPVHGIYFSSGNHDEFGEMPLFAAAMQKVGIRVLANEAVRVDGLAVIGVSYHDSGSPVRFRTVLQALRPAPREAAVLLNHVPTRLPIAEETGIALQLSGHTHAGQIFPFTWLTRRVFGHFTSGLHHYGSMAVYTSTGAGSWGPPMRVGSQSEMVLLNFE